MNSTIFKYTQTILTADGEKGSSMADFFGSQFAIGLYLALLMLLVGALAAAVLVALHLVRKDAENISKNEMQNAEKPQNGDAVKEELGASRFSQLTSLDNALKNRDPGVFYTCSLDQMCRSFRDFAAGKLGLYYDIADIRRFIAGMGMSKLIILRGMSGTGKTSLAYAAGEFFGNPSAIVPIQPMWKERSDMIGYFNEFTKKFNETTMLCKLYEAGGREDVYITVLDEVNIARIEYYFAEFLSLQEIPDPSRRYLDVVADSWANDPERIVNGKILLPDNMWFVGTANNDDSTFAISDKVYDRAAVIDLEKRSTPFACKAPPPCHISYAELSKLFAKAKQTHEISPESRSKLAELDLYLRDIFRVSFGNRIMKQIETYVPIMLACGGSEEDAIDDIIARKILRKLEQLSPAYVKSQADGLCELLDRLFGIENLPQSNALIIRFKRNV